MKKIIVLFFCLAFCSINSFGVGGVQTSIYHSVNTQQKDVKLDNNSIILENRNITIKEKEEPIEAESIAVTLVMVFKNAMAYVIKFIVSLII